MRNILFAVLTFSFCLNAAAQNIIAEEELIKELEDTAVLIKDNRYVVEYLMLRTNSPSRQQIRCVAQISEKSGMSKEYFNSLSSLLFVESLRGFEIDITKTKVIEKLNGSPFIDMNFVFTPAGMEYSILKGQDTFEDTLTWEQINRDRS